MEKKIQVLSSGKRLNHSHKSYGLDLYEYEFVEMVIERKKRTSITFIVENEKDRTREVRERQRKIEILLLVPILALVHKFCNFICPPYFLGNLHLHFLETPILGQYFLI
jgi:hypothetical protein